ncbi:MAG: hypothetical protein NC036_06915 [Muribaculaceae bacterium]|nr:hypothetical protein [Muribaculaceae bacterium]
MRNIAVFTLLFPFFLSSCDRIEEFFNPPKNPVSLAEGVLGVWEINHISFPSCKLLVCDRSSGVFDTVTQTTLDFAVKKESPYYGIIKITDSTMVLLTHSDLIEVPMMKTYPYTLREDSVVDCNLLRPIYENSTWTITDIKRNNMRLEYFGSGPLAGQGETSDTISLGSKIVISFIRLK